MSNKRNYITWIGIIILFITITYFVINAIVTIDKIGIEAYLANKKELGILIFSIISFVQPICLPTPEIATLLAGSSIFGSKIAWIIAYPSTILGIITMFMLARIGSKKLITKLVSSNLLDKYQRIVSKNETLIIFGLFIIPILTDEAICVGAGLSKINFIKFTLIALFSKAIIISTIIFIPELSQYLI